MEAEGLISEVMDGQGFTCFVPFSATYLLRKRNIESVSVQITDARRITPRQRGAVFSLVGSITEWMKAPPAGKWTVAEKETLREMHLLYVLEAMGRGEAEDKETVRRAMTLHYCRLLDIVPFSLSDTDMTTANDFIGWLIDLCVEHGIPAHESLLNLCEDIGRYLYACVKHRRCAICGGRADIHEWGEGKPGMGRNRAKMHHSGQLVEPLCRLHHREVEQIGQQSFDEKYHLEPIALDDELCEKIRWKK